MCRVRPPARRRERGDRRHSRSARYRAAPNPDRGRSVDRAARPNLHLREVDAAAAFTRKRREFEEAFAELEAVKLMDFAPPGIDEVFGMLSVLQSQDRYARLVVDTAPTGHALRLLETPEI